MSGSVATSGIYAYLIRNTKRVRLILSINFKIKFYPMNMIHEHLPQVAFSYNTSHLPLQLLNISGYVIMVLLNYLSQIYFPKSLGVITDEWDLLIAPDGYAFSIWGLIYSFLGIFMIY